MSGLINIYMNIVNMHLWAGGENMNGNSGWKGKLMNEWEIVDGNLGRYMVE